MNKNIHSLIKYLLEPPFVDDEIIVKYNLIYRAKELRYVFACKYGTVKLVKAVLNSRKISPIAPGIKYGNLEVAKFLISLLGEKNKVQILTDIAKTVDDQDKLDLLKANGAKIEKTENAGAFSMLANDGKADMALLKAFGKIDFPKHKKQNGIPKNQKRY